MSSVGYKSVQLFSVQRKASVTLALACLLASTFNNNAFCEPRENGGGLA